MTRTKMVNDPYEISKRPVRSAVSGQEKQISGKFYSSTRDVDS
ncbi:hypothetical protein ACFLQP_01350 [Acidobacteriota bacterium]